MVLAVFANWPRPNVNKLWPLILAADLGQLGQITANGQEIFWPRPNANTEISDVFYENNLVYVYI